MLPYISEIKEFIKMSSKGINVKESGSLLEMLWYFYTSYHPISSDKIDAGFAEIEPVIKSLSQKRKRRILRLITDLCAEHEQAAFMEGVRVGGQLLMEIREDWDDLWEKPDAMPGHEQKHS